MTGAASGIGALGASGFFGSSGALGSAIGTNSFLAQAATTTAFGTIGTGLTSLSSSFYPQQPR